MVPTRTMVRREHERAQKAPDGTIKAFTSLEDLFKAHADFYKSYSPQLWSRLEPWFEESMRELKKLLMARLRHSPALKISSKPMLIFTNRTARSYGPDSNHGSKRA